jgi:endoglucanase
MTAKIDFDLLSRVCNPPGVSGFEDAVQDVVRGELEQTCEEVRRDVLGNVIGLKRSAAGRDARRVVLAAHADEIGMMVKHISPEGWIRIAPIGGLHAPSMVSQPVIVHGREPVRGVIVPDHGEAQLAPRLEDMQIDLGRPPEEVRKLVAVGDPVTFAGDVYWLNDEVVTGRNFDDRIGTYCLVETMRQLGPTQVDVYAVSTVQEEVGLRGIPGPAYAIEPEIGIAIDGSICKNPFPRPHDPTCDFGAGTGVYVMDSRTIGSPGLVSFLLDLGEREDIPCQRNIGGGTDASIIQRSRSGALATTVGAPVRYMHSTVQLCHTRDIAATVALLKSFLEHAHELPLGSR